MSRGFEEVRLNPLLSNAKNFADLLKPVAGNGDAAVDGKDRSEGHSRLNSEG